MDYYALLGVSRNAKEDDIKKAFRKLALEYHPDKHQSAAPDMKIKAAQKFQAVTEAYETLGNGARRLSYDRAGGRQSGQHKSSARQYNPRAYNYHGYTTETRPRGTMFGFFSAFARGMTRTDAIFHAAMAGIFVFGAMFASFAGDALWDRWNSGRLFQHIQAPDKPRRKMGAKAAEADS